MKINYFLLCAILIFFLFTRLYQISSIPPSLYWDEASIGYNAYSVLQTGKDEWGKFLPIHFKSFGEYKLPVYIYSVVISEALLGLNGLAVRLPAVLFSLGSLFWVYLLAKEIFQKKEIALWGTFFLAISPWFFIFSRTGYEASVGLFFYLLGLFTYFRAKNNYGLLLISSVSFVLSFYSYNGFRVIVPFTLIILTIYLLKLFNLKSIKAIIFIFLSGLIFSLSLIPVINWVAFNQGTSRLEAVGIFNPIDTKKEIFSQFAKNYLTHFQGSFLLSGDKNLRSQIPRMGQIYWPDLIFIIVGIFYIIKTKKTYQYLPLLLLFISFVPAAITRESPHALRSLSATPFLAMLAGFGVVLLINKFSQFSKFKYLILVGYLLMFSNYFYNFLGPYQAKSAEHWQYGYKEVFTQYKEQFSQYDHVIISDMYNQPYIFALFYLKYDPNKFRLQAQYNQSKRKATSLVKSLDKFIFNNVDFYSFPKGKTLIFAHPSEKLTEISEKGVIRNPDNSISLYVYEYQK